MRFAVVGGAAFGALTFLFTSCGSASPPAHPDGWPPGHRGILFLACQCFAGMLL
ncbi:hypothetical protein M5E87_19640 [Flavonifractor plautii]|nr:hypothetical protein M5E87_19640 [Flavonifractor plautii]